MVPANRFLRRERRDALVLPAAGLLAGPVPAFALAVFSGGASMRCLDAILPSVAVDLHGSVGSAGGTVSAYALSYGAFQLLYGPLADRAGAFRLVAWTACMSAVAAAGCVFAPTLTVLIVLRFLAGAFAAAVGPLTLVWLSRTIETDRRPLAFAQMAAAVILGTAAGQVGGGVIGGVAGWRWIFASLATLFGLAGLWLVLVARSYPAVVDRPAPAQEIAFHRPQSLLRRPAVRWTLACVGVEGFGMFLSLAYVGTLLQARFGAGAAKAGIVFSGYGLGGLAFVLASRMVLEALGDQVRAGFGGCLVGCGFLVLFLAPSEPLAALALFAVGFGFLMLHNVLQTSASRMAEDRLGTAISLFAAVSCLGQAAGAATGGWLVDREGVAVLLPISSAILAGLGVALARLRCAA